MGRFYITCFYSQISNVLPHSSASYSSTDLQGVCVLWGWVGGGVSCVFCQPCTQRSIIFPPSPEKLGLYNLLVSQVDLVSKSDQVLELKGEGFLCRECRKSRQGLGHPEHATDAHLSQD